MFWGSVRGSHRTKLWESLFGTQISVKMGKMKSGIGRASPHLKKPKKVETEGKNMGRKRADATKRIQSKS